MLPYFAPPIWHLGPIEIHAFGLLAALAVLLGNWIIIGRCRRLGLNSGVVETTTFWMVASGLCGAHLVKLLYMPDLWDRMAARPMLLFDLSNGIASFGGFAGAAAGALICLRLRRVCRRDRWRYLNAVGYALPFSWALARIGCALAHDHPGVRADNWLAVHFPGGGRYDLGLLEAGFTLLIAFFYLIPACQRRLADSYLGLFLVIYGPFRFVLDQLHESPARYGGWTIDQYGSAIATLAGALILLARGAAPPPKSIPYLAATFQRPRGSDLTMRLLERVSRIALVRADIPLSAGDQNAYLELQHEKQKVIPAIEIDRLLEQQEAALVQAAADSTITTSRSLTEAAIEPPTALRNVQSGTARRRPGHSYCHGLRRKTVSVAQSRTLPITRRP
jgi:phosphatidylglycerol:prolipoprotein diacylglycerol transferase